MLSNVRAPDILPTSPDFAHARFEPVADRLITA
jgi:hypothetical protein